MGKKETRERVHQYSCFSAEKLANGSKDTAILPKYVETVNRCACNGERLAANDVKARKSEKSDIIMVINGKRCKIEVKCSAGAVFYAQKDGFGNALDLPDTLEDFSESDILADADYVIYTPDTFAEWLENPAQVIKSCFVMSRQDFIGLLLATTKGKNYGLKIDKARVSFFPIFAILKTFFLFVVVFSSVCPIRFRHVCFSYSYALARRVRFSAMQLSSCEPFPLVPVPGLFRKFRSRPLWNDYSIA